MSSLVGRTLSRYEIVDEISRGGMGVVYRARDTRLNRDVALKVLPPELVADPARRARFVQEAQSASALEHPHIAVIHEIDEVDGISFIAMELVRGERLSDVVARGPLSPARALDLAEEIAEGLARAHDKGIVHRDLKPANVMLTEDGHAKIIDFGLAKLVEALSGDSRGPTMLKNETDPGMIVGTVTYMSPEQARGGKVDHRSDVFSFGVVLFEMLVGRPPFRGSTGIDTMHAILHDPVPPLPPLGGAIMPEAVVDVQRILEKCLAKDPDARYQGMRDVVVDLRGARRRLESTSLRASTALGAAARSGAWTREGLMHAQQYVYAAVVLAVVTLAAVGLLKQRWTATPAAPAHGDKPSIAVLYFENNTGSAQLDWLRTGLTDMLVTDLSQSPDVEVLGTDQLVQLLSDMKRQDDRVVSFDTVRELARRSGIRTVLLGSYVKAGDTIRITAKLQDAATGRIVSAERVDAANESTLFRTVDDLTRRIRAQFATAFADPTRPLLSRPGAAAQSVSATPLDRDLKDVTTGSIDAYREYAAGINLHERGREADAMAPFERALAIDPSFALAEAKLAVVHNNLNHPIEYEAFARRAFEHRDRISARERHYIEGLFYSLRLDTYQQSIDAYKKAVELFPDHASARHNLALQYERLERYEDAIVEFEELHRRKATGVFSATGLAFVLVRAGDYARAESVLRELLDASPDNAEAHFNLGAVLGQQRKTGEAIAELRRSESLDPHEWRAIIVQNSIATVQERWSDAEALRRRLQAMPEPAGRFFGAIEAVRERLLRGRAAEALALLAPLTVGRPSGQTALARNESAIVRLARREPQAAFDEARRAVDDAHGVGESPRLSLLVQGISAAATGSEQSRRAATTELQRISGALPSERLKRWNEHLDGRIALERGDARAAADTLVTAERRLAPYPVVPSAFNESVSLIFDTGAALLASGQTRDARARFARIVEGDFLRIFNPLEFVRSLYFLAQCEEALGDAAKAAEHYRKFLDYWADGDLDRDHVAAARAKLGR